MTGAGRGREYEISIARESRARVDNITRVHLRMRASRQLTWVLWQRRGFCTYVLDLLIVHPLTKVMV